MGETTMTKKLEADLAEDITDAKADTPFWEGEEFLKSSAERIMGLEAELCRLREREQDARMLSDPDISEAYAMLRDEVLELVSFCRENGEGDVGIGEAFGAIFQKNAAKVFRALRHNAAAKALAAAVEAKHASPGRLSGAESFKKGFASMTDEEFERQIMLAKAGRLAARD